MEARKARSAFDRAFGADAGVGAQVTRAATLGGLFFAPEPVTNAAFVAALIVLGGLTPRLRFGKAALYPFGFQRTCELVSVIDAFRHQTVRLWHTAQ